MGKMGGKVAVGRVSGPSLAAGVLAVAMTVSAALLAPTAARAQGTTIDETSYGNWTLYAYAENGVFSHCGVDTYYHSTGRELGLQVRDWGFDMVLLDPRWSLPQGQIGSAFLQVGRYTTYAPAEVSGAPDTVYIEIGWNDAFLDAFALSQRMSVQLPTGAYWEADLTGTARLVSLLDDCIRVYRDYGRGGTVGGGVGVGGGTPK